MKQKLIIFKLLTVLVLTSCQKDTSQQPEQNSSEEIISAVRGERLPRIESVYLAVTVRNEPDDQILSDNGTPYIHGTDRVEAQILSSDGNFYMNTNNNTVKLPIRTMQFLAGSAVTLGEKRNYSLRTSIPLDPAINGGNTKWVQDLSVGESQIMSMRAWGVQEQGVVDWKLLFRNGDENNSTSSTDYVRVTRVAGNTWTIEPGGVSETAARVRLVTGCDAPLGSEYYHAPFKLTLVKK